MRKFNTGFRIAAKKFALCLNCHTAHSHSTKKTCSRCKKDAVQIFDSQSEASRYLYLNTRPNICSIETQVEFELQAPRINFDESWGGKRPSISHNQNKPKVITAARYRADFVYLDMDNPKGWIIEDFKPYNASTGKPIIDQKSQLKLNWLHAQCGHVFDIIVSYQVTKGGYETKLIKPTDKSKNKKK